MKPKKVHQALHLQHHRHTGRVLHHRHTSYRGLAIVLGLATVGVIGLNIMARVTAEQLYVYARIAAPIPTSASSITSFTDGTTVHTQALEVHGACPSATPPNIVDIVDNGTSIGSVACRSDGTFALTINLQPGMNTLVVRTYTITDDTGPESSPIQVTYVPPQAARGGLPPSAAIVPPLTLQPGKNYIVYGPSRDAIWNGAFAGGVPPYTVSIDWGDEAHNTLTVSDTAQHTFTHHYHRMKSYDVTVHVADTVGNELVEHLAAVTPYIAPVISNTIPSGDNSFWNSLAQALGSSSLAALYVSYLLVIIAFGLMWLRRHPFVYARVPAKRPTHHTRPRNAAKRRKAR